MTEDDRSGFEALLAGAHRELPAPRTVGAPAGSRVRFELYHADFSVCSHKVRATLFEKGAPFDSWEMRLPLLGRFVPDCYRPGYVRMRMQGAPDARLADGYTGRSATSSEGFDPCVVPTLVDRDEAKVVVDSTAICRYVDRHGPSGSAPLVPPALQAEIERQIAIVDAAPHPAILYGATPGEDRRPALIRGAMQGVHEKKRVALERMIERVGDDPALVRAYRAKISKEMGSKAFTGNADAMRAALDEMKATVEALDKQLSTQPGPWSCGAAYTLADVMWAVHLYRLSWAGLADLWADRASVREYALRAVARPSFRAGVASWPGVPPSEHLPEHATLGARARFAWRALRDTSWREVVLG